MLQSQTPSSPFNSTETQNVTQDTMNPSYQTLQNNLNNLAKNGVSKDKFVNNPKDPKSNMFHSSSKHDYLEMKSGYAKDYVCQKGVHAVPCECKS